jgi:tRNA G10  N-methylase Trm11
VVHYPYMTQSILVLGRQPELGLAELESLYGAASVSSVTPQVAGLDLPAASVDFARLGGSTRLAKVLTELPGTNWKTVEKHLAKAIPEHLQHLPAEGKLQLGFSAYGMGISPARMVATGLTLKKIIRAKGRSVRLVPNQETELGTAQVLHNHLTGPMGWELLVIATTKGTTLLAQTTAVQDIESYTTRDRERPKRDARVGMLPPKLAQIIINLATGQIASNQLSVVSGQLASDAKPTTDNRQPSTTLLDPFCGTGVVLQEALLMGYNVYGTDLEQRMVDYSRENLEWFGSGQTLPGTSRLEKGDATDHQWQPPVDAVACETYLGRAFTGMPDAATLQKTVQDCNLILSKFLRNIHGQLAPGTRLCLAVPAWQTAPDRFKHLPLIDGLADLGYNRVSFEHVRDTQLLYYREDQIVARQLLVITRN